MAYITIDEDRRTVHMHRRKKWIPLGQSIMYKIQNKKLYIYEQFFMEGILRCFGGISGWHKLEKRILKSIQEEDKKRFERLV